MNGVDVAAMTVARKPLYPPTDIPSLRRLVIPDHREVAKGTLRAIVRQAGITLEQFNALLK